MRSRTPSRSTWRPCSSRPWPKDRSPTSRRTYSYADHLRLRRQPDRCLEVVHRALKTPQASQRGVDARTCCACTSSAVDMILARTDDAARFDKAGAARPVPARLLRSAVTRRWATCSPARSTWTVRGWLKSCPGVEEGPASRQAQSKLRTSALSHLKIAAANLPDIAEAQAKYGVALVLAQEQNLGRQYLQQRPAPGQPGAAVSALGRLDDPPGRLSRGGRADRAGDAPPGRAGDAPARHGGDAPPAPRRAVPGPPQSR